MGPFAFNIGQRVELAESGERGTVIGRAEYQDQPPLYLVRYRAADGRQTEAWWAVSALKADL